MRHFSLNRITPASVPPGAAENTTREGHVPFTRNVFAAACPPSTSRGGQWMVARPIPPCCSRGGLGARFGSAPAPCPPPGTCLQRMPARHGGESICNRKDRGTGAGSPPPFRGQAVHQIQMGIPSRDLSGWSSTCAVEPARWWSSRRSAGGGRAARGMEPNRRAR